MNRNTAQHTPFFFFFCGVSLAVDKNNTKLLKTYTTKCNNYKCKVKTHPMMSR